MVFALLCQSVTFMSLIRCPKIDILDKRHLEIDMLSFLLFKLRCNLSYEFENYFVTSLAEFVVY